MKRVKVTNSVNGLTYQADFEDPHAWIDEQVATNAWGEPERWVPDSMLSDDDKARSLDTRTVVIREPNGVDDPGESVVEYRLPPDYTIEITDVGAEYDQRKILDNAKKAREVGQQVIDQVWSVNTSNPNMTPELFNQIVNDPQLQQIERLLRNGSLKTVRAMLTTLDSPFFSDTDKQRIIALIDSSGLV